MTTEDRIEKVIAARVVPKLAMICIGRPGEKFLGSSIDRIFVGDEQWKEIVQALLEESQLVIARVGTTAGFQWEFDVVREKGMLNKTILFLCASFGHPMMGQSISEAMKNFGIDVSGIDLSDGAYFCVFENGDPIFLPVSWEAYPNFHLMISDNSKLLIIYLKARHPELFRKSLVFGWLANAKRTVFRWSR